MDKGAVENAIRGIPFRETFFKRAENWTAEEINYALGRFEQMTDASAQLKVEGWLNEIKSKQLGDARQSAIESKLTALAKPHWTVKPNFWFTVISAIAAVVAAYYVVRHEAPPPPNAAVSQPANSLSTPSPSPALPKPR